MENLETNNNSCFPSVSKALLDKSSIKQPYYAIGVDTYDKEHLAYCLVKELNGVSEILLLKTMSNESEFNQEVDNLAKYFNANVFRDSK